MVMWNLVVGRPNSQAQQQDSRVVVHDLARGQDPIVAYLPQRLVGLDLKSEPGSKDAVFAF